jgi:uroporphyrinogen decarboxylase
MPGEMNPRERWGLLLIDEFPDRPPVYPLVTAHAAKAYGCNLKDYCSEGKVLAEAQLFAQAKYGHEGLSVFSDVGIIAEAMGSKYLLREFEVPILIEPIIRDSAQIADLRLPDCVSAGRLPVYLEAIERLYQSAGDILPIFAFIPAPFTTAGGLRGVDDFLVDALTDTETAHRLLEIALQSAIRFCDECILAGALPILVDPLASGSVISRDCFQNFALPYLQRLLKHLHRYDLDITLHICGDTSPMLDLIADTGADLFSFDQVSVEKVAQAMGKSVRLVGNITPADLLAFSPKDMAKEAEAISQAGLLNPKGFVLSTGCEVPIMCEEKKLHRVIEVGKKMRY